MNRVYINGVHNINFDGKKLSFSLTDTFQKNSGEIVRNEIAILKQIFEFYSNINKPIIFVESKNLDEICNNIGADSLKFIETEDMINVLGEGHCTGCFNKDYKDKLEW